MKMNIETYLKDIKRGTTSIWFPLESGILAGRYLNGIPEDSRYHLKHDNAKCDIQPYLDNKKEWDEKLLKLKDIAEKKLNCTLAQLAIAWVIANHNCSTTILGASKVSQLEETIKAVEIYKKNTPKGEIYYRDWQELLSRRNINLNVDYKKGGPFN